MKIEIQFTLVDNEKWLLANLYALTNMNKRLEKNDFAQFRLHSSSIESGYTLRYTRWNNTDKNSKVCTWYFRLIQKCDYYTTRP